MKKSFLILFFFCVSNFFAQYEIGGGMGLSYFNAPDLVNYIETNFSNVEIPSFSSSADFFIQFNYNISTMYQLSIEYDYNIYSYNSDFSVGFYDFEINQHKPSLIGYYLINGEGYKFKFGGGLGLRIAQAQEKIGSYGSSSIYKITGMGFLGKAQGDTKIGSNFYALIAGEIIYDLTGEITTVTNSKIDLSSFGIGIKLGVIYYF